MGTVLAVANQKGGVGKTTTTVNLGMALAKKGKRVLIADLDPQGNVAACFGIQAISDGLNITTILQKVLLGEKVPNGGIMRQSDEEKVDLLLSDINVAGMDGNLINLEVDREFVLKEYVDEIKENYDYVILDTMPSLGMLTINALVAADEVLIPAQAQYLSAKGLEQLLRTIHRLQKRLNPGLKVSGILMTMVDGRTNYAKDILENIRVSYGGTFRIFENVIPRSVKAEESSAAACSIHKHDPKGKVALAYQKLADEVLA
jgi:chromosome partitioning protein